MKDKDKMRIAIRAFLCANKGKRYSSKQLSDFLNEHRFSGRFGCTSANVARLLDGNYPDTSKLIPSIFFSFLL